MCEFTKTAEASDEKACGNTVKFSDLRLIVKFFLRAASLFMVYFLLDSNFNFVSCAVCMFLLMTELCEILSEK